MRSVAREQFGRSHFEVHGSRRDPVKLALRFHADRVRRSDHQRTLRVPQGDDVALSRDDAGAQIVGVRIGCR